MCVCVCMYVFSTLTRLFSSSSSFSPPPELVALCRDASSYPVGATDRPWRWQKCTEVAYLQIAPKTGSLRSPALTLDALLGQCEAIFGEGTFPATEQANAVYGGQTPNATDVFYTNFSDDPWKYASINFTDPSGLAPTLQTCFVECTDCGK